MANQNVRITEGIFKGIKGVITSIEHMSPYSEVKVTVEVDRDNVITVNSSQIEFTDKEYLITITNIDQYVHGKESLSIKHPPYIMMIEQSEVDNYIRNLCYKINPGITEDIYGYSDFKYRVTATPVESIKTDFKINGSDIDTKSLAHIIGRLK